MRAIVAEEVRALLARKRISASELARRMDVTQRYISRRLTGETAFDVDDLAKIAFVLGVHVADLLPRPTEGRLITTVLSKGAEETPPNGRSGNQTERPTRTSPPSRTQSIESTRRPARIRPSSTR